MLYEVITVSNLVYAGSSGPVKRGGAEQAEHETPAVAPQGQATVLGVELGKDRPVAFEQLRPEPEQLDLLGVVLACLV